MTPLFTQYWWIFLLRGLFAIIVGIIALLMPGITFTTLVIFLGAYILVDGTISVITAISGRKTMEYWGWSASYWHIEHTGRYCYFYESICNRRCPTLSCCILGYCSGYAGDCGIHPPAQSDHRRRLVYWRACSESHSVY